MKLDFRKSVANLLMSEDALLDPRVDIEVINAWHKMGLKEAVLSVLDEIGELTHNGRGTILWEVDTISEKINEIRKRYEV